MKKISILIFALTAFASYSFSQNNWVQKASLSATGRGFAVAFSLNDMGYIGSGVTGVSLDDFWEYDPADNTWRQVASIPSVRHYAYSFVIGDFAFVGGGINGTQSTSPISSFHKYDPSKNKWTAIKSLTKGLFGGRAFASGGKGYIVMGYNGTAYVKNFFEYDPNNDSWTQKTNFPGTARLNCSSFSIGNNSYVGLGFDGATYFDDFYCYNSDSDTWHQINSFPGGGVTAATAFSAGGKGYVGGGYDGADDLKGFYEYNSANDTWTIKKSYEGNAFRGGVAVTIKDKGYMGLGYFGTGPSMYDEWFMYEAGTNVGTNSIRQNLGISLFPNPAAGFCILNLCNPHHSTSRIALVNMSGQVILTKNISLESTKIQLDGIQTGNYVVQVWDGIRLLDQQKIVKQ